MIQAAGADCENLFQRTAFQAQPEEFPLYQEIRHCDFGIARGNDSDVLEPIVLV